MDSLPPVATRAVREAVHFLAQRYQHDDKALRDLDIFLRWSTQMNDFERTDDTLMLSRLVRSLPVPAVTSRMPSSLNIAILEAKTFSNGKVTSEWNPLTAVKRALATNAEVILAPEWFSCQEGRLLSFEEKELFESELLKASEGKRALIVPGSMPWIDQQGRYHNTALAISNGRLLASYDKQNDGEDRELGKAYGADWLPGKTPPPVFQWKGLRVGLEICRDHGDSLLRWSLERKNETPVDLQLIVSAGVPLQQAHVGLGGVAIVAQVPEIDPSARMSEVVTRSADGSIESVSLSSSHATRVETGVAMRSVSLCIK